MNINLDIIPITNPANPKYAEYFFASIFNVGLKANKYIIIPNGIGSVP